MKTNKGKTNLQITNNHYLRLLVFIEIFGNHHNPYHLYTPFKFTIKFATKTQDSNMTKSQNSDLS